MAAQENYQIISYKYERLKKRHQEIGTRLKAAEDKLRGLACQEDNSK